MSDAGTGDARNGNEAAAEARRLRRLLREMFKMAEHAGLTGSLGDGAAEAVATYNGVLRRLGELGMAPGSLFPELPPDANFDRVGVASRLLAGYLAEEPEDGPHRHAGHPPNIVIGSLGNLGDMDKLRGLGQTLRDNLADLIRGNATPEGEKTRVAVKVESSLRRAEAAIAEAEAAVAEAHADAPREAPDGVRS
jgi:hypothetical protein